MPGGVIYMFVTGDLDPAAGVWIWLVYSSQKSQESFSSKLMGCKGEWMFGVKSTYTLAGSPFCFCAYCTVAFFWHVLWKRVPRALWAFMVGPQASGKPGVRHLPSHTPADPVTFIASLSLGSSAVCFLLDPGWASPGLPQPHCLFCSLHPGDPSPSSGEEKALHAHPLLLISITRGPQSRKQSGSQCMGYIENQCTWPNVGLPLQGL